MRSFMLKLVLKNQNSCYMPKICQLSIKSNRTDPRIFKGKKGFSGISLLVFHFSFGRSMYHYMPMHTLAWDKTVSSTCLIYDNPPSPAQSSCSNQLYKLILLSISFWTSMFQSSQKDNKFICCILCFTFSYCRSSIQIQVPSLDPSLPKVIPTCVTN